MDWNIEQKSWPFIKDSGEATVKASKTEIDLTFKITDAKKEIIQITKCKIKVGNLDIDVEGAAKPIYDLVTNVFEDEIKQQLGTQICSDLKGYEIDL